MLSAILLLALGLLSFLLALNALWPVRQQWLAFPSFFASWLAIELVIHAVVIQATLALALIWLGALDEPIGWIGLALLVASWLARVVLLVRGRGSAAVVSTALAEAGIADHPDRVPLKHLVLPFWMRRSGVEKIANVEFRRVAGRTLRLDIYRPADSGGDRPVLAYFHGGAWTVGDKREQGLPMLNHLAANGWLAVSANYRLSPGAAFPDHLEDAKAAIAWIRRHAAQYGADPGFIAVSGGSAGGHLAGLAALTPNQAEYQPGFETVDTTVQAAVPLYGIYDFTNRLGVQYDGFVSLFLEPIVMRAFIADEPELFRAASPIYQVSVTAPPFLVVQGDRDTLAPVEEARAFVAELRAVSSAPVVYMELPGAQHAFDLFYSVRTARTIEGILSFLEAARLAAGDRAS